MLASVVRFVITAAAVPLCGQYMDGVTILDMRNAILVGLALACVYTVLRPAIRLLLSVFNFCTLGLLYVFVDAWMVQLAAKLVGNSVAFDSYWWALAVALAINAARMLVDVLRGEHRR